MKPVGITLVLACICLAAGDVAHLKAAKAKLVGRLKHHKRGIFSAVPPFKLGHDIPRVSHSVLKPLVVTYPPTAAVAAVKVPLSLPTVPRFPIHAGHRLPLHPHFGLKFPHHTKTLVVPKPDQHFHHHHHHIPPRPLVPVVPARPVVPIPQPSPTVLHSIPVPSPPVLVQSALEPAAHAHPVPVAPPPVHFPVRPIVPIAPIQPAHAHAFSYAQQFPYVIRPGNAVQTSYFATYPRYPLVNYQSPVVPLPAPAPASPVFDQVLFNRPPLQLFPQAVEHPGIDHAHGHPSVLVEPTPTLLHPTQAALPQPGVHLQHVQPTVHLQPAQPTLHFQSAQPPVHVQPTQPAVPLDHDGWSPVPAQPHDLIPQQPDGHFLTNVQQEGHFHQDGHYPQQETHHFTQEQGTQVFEQHIGSDQQYHDYQNQLQHHIQQQIDQAQYEQHLNNQHQLNQEYGAPQQEYGEPNHDFSQQSHDFSQQNHDFSQQNQDFAQHAHEYAQHVQEYAQHEQDYAQTNEYNLQQQPAQEYGAPQQLEGRSAEGEGEEQRYHNHIPLGLQPPIDRPLEHFR